MKKILVIDESTLFRDFLAQKLKVFGFEVIVGVNGLDGATKLRRETPDLVIMDYYLSRKSSLELLQAKKSDPNTARVPVIMVSGRVGRDTLVELAAYNVRKFFTKPITVDALTKSIAEILGVTVEIDTTPCIVEAHFNDQILFVEVAQGLNTEKFDLLRYKIAELLELYQARSPKVLVIMSSLEITPDDSLKLGVLMNTVVESTGSRPKDVKILTTSKYVRTYVSGRPDFHGMEVTDSLETAMDGLLGGKAETMMDRENNTVHHDFLQPSTPKKGLEETILTRFEGEQSAEPDLSARTMGTAIAVVDDDFVIREMVKAVLSETGIVIREYENGKLFLDDTDAADTALIFLDLMMPVMDGFQVMAELQRLGRKTPIIVFSALSQRETVIKAMRFGVTSYLTKPLDPEAILMKTRAVLQTSF